jgi:hypothetical protein
MWSYKESIKKWISTKDRLKRDDFNLYNQELEQVRFYSKCLSGSTYTSINNTDNLYPILEKKSKNWALNFPFSEPINLSQKDIVNSSSTFTDFNNSNLEYNYTQKNYFSPLKSVKEFKKNYEYVDVATIERINIDIVSENFIIDGVRLLEGHTILVKDQFESVVLDSNIDPDTIFDVEWIIINQTSTDIEYLIPEATNGLYVYNEFKLIRKEIIDYQEIINKSFIVKLGTLSGKQFHIERLKNNNFPLLNGSDRVLFKENKNWLLRHQVDYNNLWDINYYDVIYDIFNNIERTIFIGEFGSILINQQGYSNFLDNKNKNKLNSIASTNDNYFIVGDKGTLLKLDKTFLTIEYINLDFNGLNNRILSNLKDISFFNSNLGLIVGNFNTIFVTEDGGNKWEKIKIDSFLEYNYNKCIWVNSSLFYIAGNNGIYIEFNKTNNGWIPIIKRISKKIDSEEEFILIEDIYDLKTIELSNWNPLFSYDESLQTLNDKKLIVISASNGTIILHDLNNSIPQHEFIYLVFDINYGSIISIEYTNNDIFYFSGIDTNTLDSGIFSFNIQEFDTIGEDNNFSNIMLYNSIPEYESEFYANVIYNKLNTEILIAGNEGLSKISTLNDILNFTNLDQTLSSRLKSRLLFLNYEIASKLNFFTDNGIYRLPETLAFDLNTISNNILSFESKSNELSWLDYIKDSNLTFEYNSITPLDESTKVLFNSDFKQTPISTTQQINSNNITINPNIVGVLAPSILDNTLSRYQFVANPINPNDSNIIYLNSYILIYKVNTNYPVEVGDVFRLESDVIDANLIANKIQTIAPFKFIYFFTDFNQNIITDIKKSTGINITNLNYFSNKEELKERFNKHIIGLAYEIDIIDTLININPLFNSYTAYYNLSLEVKYENIIYYLNYNETFLKFGYTPTYNILDYLSNLDSSYFTANKIYTSLPSYVNLTQLVATIDNVGNKLLITEEFKFIWDSIPINIFLDININITSINKINTQRLLVIEKYFDSNVNRYIIELNEKINSSNITHTSIDILSRRRLDQISYDLIELNNIQTIKRSVEINDNEFNTFDNKIKSMFNTDSYAKVLLADKGTKERISGVIYTDYLNNLSLNICNLPKNNNINIVNTANISGNLLLITDVLHNLVDGDQVRVIFNGGVNSSEYLNTSYFGYHHVQVVNGNQLRLDINYETPINISDTGILKTMLHDPFLNYQPIDLLEVGVDKKNRIAIELDINNTILTDNNIFKLVNIDFNKFRFRLIDGLDLDTLLEKYQWVFEAEISNAVIGFDDEGIIWYKGIWECGRWFGGKWISGTWLSGDWYDGIWMSKTIKDSYIKIEFDEKSSNDISSIWLNGRWFGGIWNNGTWFNGRWYDGIWEQGTWLSGMWNNGEWLNGEWKGGVWINGKWSNGIFNSFNTRGYWIDGEWKGGDFENGMWFNGIFNQENSESRFGTKSDNSRAATWQSGEWFNGSFHSTLNITDNIYQVSESHRYSIWNTGNWFDGNFYGGVTFNINFKSGTWHGGILEDISVIGFILNDNAIIIDGLYRFKIGYEFNLIGNPTVGLESYGNDLVPKKYKVIQSLLKEDEKITTIIVDKPITIDTPIQYTGIKLVSEFTGSKWKSGIWTNGIFNNGIFEGGIWYNGIFKGQWT